MVPAFSGVCRVARINDLKETDVNQTYGSDKDTSDNGGRASTTTRHIADSAHKTIDRAADYAQGAAEKVQEKAEKLQEKWQEGNAATAEQFDEGVKQAREYIEKNPLMSAGAAFAAGLIVSMLLRR